LFMHADLERVTALQKIVSATHEAESELAQEPEREKAFDGRLEEARQAVASAKEKLTANQAARREIEKEVAVHQGRLSKFRDQAMAVKTNQEYHAIQKEIAFAQGEVKALEDRILERMLEADEITADVKRTEAALASEQKTIDAERKKMAAEHAELRKRVEQLAGDREAIVRALDPKVFATFELVANRRHGVAVAEARDGICTVCHVRLRPQVFNTVRRNEAIIQCDSCQRILYFVPLPAPAPTDVTQSAS